MKVLGIETATGVCGVAVVEEEVLLAERWSSEQHIHSERIVRSVQVVLSESHLELREVDVIAVSIGPGSFTGLRIGLSAAKGLCYASGKPLVAVPTLDALAHRVVGLCEEGKIVCTVLDAKRDEVYSAWYERRGPRMERKSDYQVLHREEFLKRLRSMSSVMLTGEDAGRSIERMRSLKRSDEDWRGISAVPLELRSVSAQAVAALGLEMMREGKTFDLAELEPMYLKEFLVNV